MTFWCLAALIAATARAQAVEPPFGDATGALDWARASARSMTPVAATPVPGSKPPPVADPWKYVTTPSPKPPESIGAYAAGCLRGGVPLELHGAGFEVMRPSRRRYYGHPRLLSFIRTLAADAPGAGIGTLLVGDLAQPRGGPTLSGHASHQTGLDVDIWYKQIAPGTTLSMSDRETINSPSMVLPDFAGRSAHWNPKAVELLRLAAGQADVERIFVNPVVKQAVCQAHAGEAWVSKLRPWWGHDDHFHVRLSCAPGDAHCAGQEAVGPGDGCGTELASWFTPERKDEARRQRTETGPPPTMPNLPALCRQVLTE